MLVDQANSMGRDALLTAIRTLLRQFDRRLVLYGERATGLALRPREDNEAYHPPELLSLPDDRLRTVFLRLVFMIGGL